jgi:hypothetical protein
VLTEFCDAESRLETDKKAYFQLNAATTTFHTLKTKTKLMKDIAGSKQVRTER